MDLVSLLIVLLVFGVILWLVQAYLPPPIRTVVTIVVVVILIIWLLRLVGIGSGYTIGHIR